MNAVASETEPKKAHSLNWRKVDALLHYWGSNRWRVGLCGGFPEQAATAGRVELYSPELFRITQYTAQGKQIRYFGGHRVLADQYWEVSPRLLAVNMAVNLLPDAQFSAVVVRYAVGYTMNEPFTEQMQANALGISVETLEDHLTFARARLGRMLVNIGSSRQARSKHVDSQYTPSCVQSPATE